MKSHNINLFFFLSATSQYLLGSSTYTDILLVLDSDMPVQDFVKNFETLQIHAG